MGKLGFESNIRTMPSTRPTPPRNSVTVHASSTPVQVFNPDGKHRVIVTKTLPGQDKWLPILTSANIRVEISQDPAIISSRATLLDLIGTRCDGVIGQLTEPWDESLFSALHAAGGKVYSNYSIGYNNLAIEHATKLGIALGNTPGVPTEACAELAVGLTLAAARRLVEADAYTRAGKYEGWLPTLFVGSMMQRKTCGLLGAGRIGAAYARMMVEGHKMNLLYYDPFPNQALEDAIRAYSAFLIQRGEAPVMVRRCATVEEVLEQSDVVSLQMNLTKETFHLIDAKRLKLMKPDAVLVNVARGPVIDEAALVEHLQQNPNFRVGLDVFEDEPRLKPGLKDCPNAIVVPHIASATMWTRVGMSIIAAANVAHRLSNYPVWSKPDDVLSFINASNPSSMPRASPCIFNAADLKLPLYEMAAKT